MRFSLAQFLLLVPAYVLGMYAAAWWQSTELVSYRFKYARRAQPTLRGNLDSPRSINHVLRLMK